MAQLKELVKLQKTVTGGTRFTKTSVEAAAGQLMKYADAKGDKKALAGLLNDLYGYIAKGEELTWEGVKEAAQPAVDWLLGHAGTKLTDSYGYDQTLLEQDLLRQVYDSYWNVSTLYTVADKAQKEITRLKIQHSNRMQELRQDHAERIAKLNSHHVEIDNRATEMFDLLVKQLAEKQGIAEQLKAQDQMAWVGAMNNIRYRAEEIVKAQVIFT